MDCLLNSGIIGERRETIHFSFNPKEPEGKALSPGLVALVSCAVIVFVSCIVIAALLKRKRLKSKRGNESVNEPLDYVNIRA